MDVSSKSQRATAPSYRPSAQPSKTALLLLDCVSDPSTSSTTSSSILDIEKLFITMTRLSTPVDLCFAITLLSTVTFPPNTYVPLSIVKVLRQYFTEATALDSKSLMIVIPLIVLLSILPLKKEDVISTTLSKAVKKLDKRLGKLIESGVSVVVDCGDEEGVGGESVQDMQDSLIGMMNKWKEFWSSESESEGSKSESESKTEGKIDDYEVYRSELKSKFDVFLSYTRKGEIPPWLPQPVKPDLALSQEESDRSLARQELRATRVKEKEDSMLRIQEFELRQAKEAKERSAVEFDNIRKRRAVQAVENAGRENAGNANANNNYNGGEKKKVRWATGLAFATIQEFTVVKDMVDMKEREYW